MKTLDSCIGEIVCRKLDSVGKDVPFLVFKFWSPRASMVLFIQKYLTYFD
jgi:hypothetical protein